MGILGGKRMGLIKGMIGLTVGASLMPSVMHGIGAIGSGMSTGMNGATQTLVGVGFVGHAVNLGKGVFK